jgi:hypothetical protein
MGTTETKEEKIIRLDQQSRVLDIQCDVRYEVAYSGLHEHVYTYTIKSLGPIKSLDRILRGDNGVVI